MPDYTLEITLLSDTAFSMGAGIVGLLDSEIQHDVLGLPTLSGRAIKGLLTNACSEILFALGHANRKRWEQVAKTLFGSQGEILDSTSTLSIGDAFIAPDLRACLARTQSQPNPSVSRQEIMASLTDIRSQTAMNPYGAPKDNSLRTMRVLLRNLKLYAPIHFLEEPSDAEKALFSACLFNVKRAGLSRNRGKGKLEFALTNRRLDPEAFSKTENEVVDLAKEKWFPLFEKAIMEEATQ